MSPSKKSIGIVGAAISGPVFALQILSHPLLRQRYKPVLFERLSVQQERDSASSLKGKTAMDTAGAGVGVRV